jgi:hypothetical protein
MTRFSFTWIFLKNIPYVTKEGKTQLNGKHNFPEKKILGDIKWIQTIISRGNGNLSFK